MNFLWFVGLVCLSSVTVNSQSDIFDLPRRFCGAHLSEALALICKGKYNVWFDAKKDVPYNELQNSDYVYDQDPEELSHPFLSRKSANALLSNFDYHRRYRRGVFDECCKKSCTTKELRSYCAQ